MRTSAAPSPSSARAELDAAVDTYVTTQLARYDRAVAAASLAEPVLRAPDLAPRTIDAVLEMLSGLATGSAIGVVLARARRGFGRKVATTIARAGARAIGTIPPPEPRPLYGLDHEPVRSFAAELRQRLRRRMMLSARSVHDALAEIAAAVAAAEPAEQHALVRVLHLLADDPVVAEPYAEHVATGWRCVVSILEASPWPDDAGAAWDAWGRRLRGERAVMTPTHEEIVARGFVMRIG